MQKLISLSKNDYFSDFNIYLIYFILLLVAVQVRLRSTKTPTIENYVIFTNIRKWKVWRGDVRARKPTLPLEKCAASVAEAAAGSSQPRTATAPPPPAHTGHRTLEYTCIHNYYLT